MDIWIINGPNLNLLQERDQQLYGGKGFEAFLAELEKRHTAHRFFYFQSNVEGEIINKLQAIRHSAQGLIINLGGYTHTSVAIADALALVKAPKIEVHLSHIFVREPYRWVSLSAPHCVGSISGFGLAGYSLAADYLIEHYK